MKKFTTEAREKIERKNRKLNELIEYIKKLHLLLAHISVNEEDLKNLKIPVQPAPPQEGVTEKEVIEQAYEAVEEVVLPQEREVPPSK
jgi:pimeloyl-CoA synthetase